MRTFKGKPNSAQPVMILGCIAAMRKLLRLAAPGFFKLALVFPLCILTCFIPHPAFCLSANVTQPKRLGEVHFTVSCSPKVQKSFETAVALLHSFQYEEAQKAFDEVTQQDPQCAMAWWGKAMSLYHQLWDWPSAATLKTGREDIEKARRLGAKTRREREYIAAAAAFYQDDPALSHAARIKAYSRALQKLYENNPGDVNAGAFYALSLVALAQEGIQGIPNRQHAIDILKPLFAKYPGNPGVDHYLIHASDCPQLAAQGLAAARNYAKIAPDSSHALHMPSHIFTRLGYWQDSIESNLASAAAAEQATKSGRDNEWGNQVHALTFLEYAYLQSGRDAEAQRVIAAVGSVPGDSASDLAQIQALFQATYLVETHQWKKAAALSMPAGDTYPRDREVIYWARILGAARSGDVAGARQDLEKLNEAYSAGRREQKKKGYTTSDSLSVQQLEAKAWLEYAEGTDDAIATMRAAVAKEGPNGVDILGMPAQEMLGDFLLELHQPAQALTAYEAALKESPNRFDGLYGAARAAELTGDTTKAKAIYAKLLKICGPTADRRELQQARSYLAQK